MNIKTMILLEMCKALGVPYAYPIPLSSEEETAPDDEECEEDTELVSVKDYPYDHVADGAEYLMNYQIFGEHERKRS